MGIDNVNFLLKYVKIQGISRIFGIDANLQDLFQRHMMITSKIFNKNCLKMFSKNNW